MQRLYLIMKELHNYYPQLGTVTLYNNECLNFLGITEPKEQETINYKPKTV